MQYLANSALFDTVLAYTLHYGSTVRRQSVPPP